MIRRWGFPARATVFLFVVAATVIGPGVAATADNPTVFGWWTTSNPNVPSEPIPTLVPSAPPTTVQPDIPHSGFEVAQLSAGYTSYAAIGYFASQATVQSVVLKLTPNAADLPNSTVEACQLSSTSPFTPADAGPVSSGPAYDCSNPVPGVEDSTAGTVTFAAGNLVRDGYLGIAIVAAGPGRMVFNAPGGSTVQTRSSPAESGPPSETPPTPLNLTQTPAAQVPSAVVPAQGEPVGVEPSVAAASPNLAATPTSSSAPAPRPTRLIAVSGPGTTTGVGSAPIGVALFVIAVVAITVRARRASAFRAGAAGNRSA
jgi:hypothetical protein